MEAIGDRLETLETEMEDEDLTEAAYTALADEVEALEAEGLEIGRRPRIMPAELASRVGTFLTLSHKGEMALDNDYYSETPLRITMVEEDPESGEDLDEGSTSNEEGTLTDDDDAAVGDDDGETTPTGGRMTFRIEETPTGSGSRTVGGKSLEIDPDNAAPGGKAMSQVLQDQLAVQRRDVLGAAMIANPALALDYMLFVMVDREAGYSSGNGTTISAGHPQDPVLTNTMPASRARDYLGQVHDGLDDSWTAGDSKVARFEAFRALGDEIKAAWLAYTVATSFVAKENYGSNVQNPLQNRLAAILDIDVASLWRPTSENFFDRVPKGALLSLLDEVGGTALSARHASQKKSEISPSCEKLFAGEAIVEPEVRAAALAWVPNAMRFNDVPDTTSDGELEVDDQTVEAGEDLTSLIDPDYMAGADDRFNGIDAGEFAGGDDDLDTGDLALLEHANDEADYSQVSAE